MLPSIPSTVAISFSPTSCGICYAEPTQLNLLSSSHFTSPKTVPLTDLPHAMYLYSVCKILHAPKQLTFVLCVEASLDKVIGIQMKYEPDCAKNS